MTTFTLRGYQRDAIDTTLTKAAAGVRRQLGVAATGLGKTVMFAHLAAEVGERTLVLAHREELVRQAADKLRQVWPGSPSIGIVKAGENDIGAHVVVASVQTLAITKRLAGLGPPFGEPEDEGASLWPTLARRPFGLVIVDEAHHAAAPSYGRILAHVGAGQPDGPLLLGVTATPDRGDGVGLDGVFDEIAWTYDMLWGIRAGYLCDLVGRRVEVDGFHTEAIATSRGDYQAGAAGQASADAGVPDATAAAILEHAPDRLTLAFTPTVATAVETYQRLRARGEDSVAWVSGETDQSERRSILRAFSAGTLRRVVNCAVLTEGYDNPAIGCVAIASPTKSRGRYVQMVGRGTRRHPDKADCLVLDLVGATDDHSLVTLPSLFGLEHNLRARAGTGDERITRIVDEHEANLVRAGKLRHEDVDLFRKMREAAALAWVDVTVDDRRRYVLQLGDSSLVLAQLDRADDSSWGAQLQHKDHKVGNHTLGRGLTMEDAQGIAEDYARTHAPKRKHVDADAGWRDRPPTPAQRAAAKRMHCDITGLTTAGQVSDAMTRHMERARYKRRQRAAAGPPATKD